MAKKIKEELPLVEGETPLNHTVTKEDITNNPELIEEGVKEGDVVEIPLEEEPTPAIETEGEQATDPQGTTGGGAEELIAEDEESLTSDDDKSKNIKRIRATEYYLHHNRTVEAKVGDIIPIYFPWSSVAKEQPQPMELHSDVETQTEQGNKNFEQLSSESEPVKTFGVGTKVVRKSGGQEMLVDAVFGKSIRCKSASPPHEELGMFDFDTLQSA